MFQNCLEKFEAVENQYYLVSLLSFDILDQPTETYLSEYKVIFAFSLWLNSLWYGSSVFPWDQFVLICPPFSVLRAEMRCRGAALKANAQLVSGRRRSVLLRLNSWSSLTLSYTILTDREILIITAFIFSPHCVWCRCKCIKLDWRTVLISYDRL